MDDHTLDTLLEVQPLLAKLRESLSPNLGSLCSEAGYAVLCEAYSTVGALLARPHKPLTLPEAIAIINDGEYHLAELDKAVIRASNKPGRSSHHPRVYTPHSLINLTECAAALEELSIRISRAQAKLDAGSETPSLAHSAALRNFKKTFKLTCRQLPMF